MELSYASNEKSLFRKYAPLVTAFARNELGRAYLGIQEDKEIGLLLPNGYHRIIDRSKNTIEAQMVVSTRAIYAPKLLPALQVYDLIHNWIEDFGQAQEFLLGYLGLTKSRDFYSLLSRMPRFLTLSKTPDAHTETTSVDGYAARTPVDESWATIVGGAGNSSDDSGTHLYTLTESQAGHTNFWRQVFRTFILFDTSSFPAAGLLTVGSNTLTLNAADTFPEAVNIRLVTSTPASNTAIVNADYTQFGTTAQCTDWDGASGARTLNTTGEASLALTGITKFGLRLAADADNSTPTWVNSNLYGRDYSSSDTGSNKPTLAITYRVPGVKFVNFI